MVLAVLAVQVAVNLVVLLLELIVVTSMLAVQVTVLAAMLFSRGVAMRRMPGLMLAVQLSVLVAVLGVQIGMTFAMLGIELAVLVGVIVVVGEGGPGSNEQGRERQDDKRQERSEFLHRGRPPLPGNTPGVLESRIAVSRVDLRAAETQALSDGEIFYAGVRFSGMPAWGDDDREAEEHAWKLVRFVRALPQMSRAEASEPARTGEAQHGGGVEHTHDEHDGAGRHRHEHRP